MHAIWPIAAASKSGRGVVPEMWSMRVLESSPRQQGFDEFDIVMFVDRSTRCLTLAGEVDGFGEAVPLVVPTAMHVWQSPLDLRSRLRVDLMMETLVDMEREGGSHFVTRVVPTCTFAVISFWQRYLCKLAVAYSTPVELVMRWLPLKNDRVPIGELLSMLQSVGWVSMPQLPQLTPPAVWTTQPEKLPGNIMDLDCIRLQPQETTYGRKVSVDEVSSISNPADVSL